jgi:nucleotide-binding universal stress UspA family protein
MYKRIMVPVDGSDGARAALDEAVRLAQVMQSEVQVVFVVEHRSRLVDANRPFPEETRPDDPATDIATATLEEAREVLGRNGVQGTVRAIDSYGDSLTTVLTRAVDEFDADLIVMNTHDSGRGIRRLLAGGVAESLLRDTLVPVLLLRAGSEIEPTPDEL